MTDLHVYVENLARKRIQSGYAGAEVIAGLLDVLDAERNGGPVQDRNWQVWAQAAGFADAGPELLPGGPVNRT